MHSQCVREPARCGVQALSSPAGRVRSLAQAVRDLNGQVAGRSQRSALGRGLTTRYLTSWGVLLNLGAVFMVRGDRCAALPRRRFR
jgi:hypothetical protein